MCGATEHIKYTRQYEGLACELSTIPILDTVRHKDENRMGMIRHVYNDSDMMNKSNLYDIDILH